MVVAHSSWCAYVGNVAEFIEMYGYHIGCHFLCTRKEGCLISAAAIPLTTNCKLRWNGQNSALLRTTWYGSKSDCNIQQYRIFGMTRVVLL